MFFSHLKNVGNVQHSEFVYTREYRYTKVISYYYYVVFLLQRCPKITFVKRFLYIYPTEQCVCKSQFYKAFVC